MELKATRRGYELTKATNVDITDNRKIRRRKGYAMWRAAAIRKIWANGDHFLSVENNILSTADGVTIYRTDMNPVGVPCFTEAGSEVYYSDGKILGKFDEGGNHTDWAVEEPVSWPTLSATGGALYPGCYNVAITFLHNDGRESGTGESAKVDVPNGGGISLTNIPQPVTAGIAKINVYCTESNGGELKKVTSLSPGTSSYTISSRLLGHGLRTQFLSPPPVSSIIAYAGSRIVCAVDEFLMISEPFTYHLFNYGERFLTFPKPINLVAPTEKGLYVSAGAVYFVPISEPKPQRKRVSKYPAISFSNFQVDGSEVGEGERDEVFAGWVAENGIIIGSEAGSVQNLTEGQIDIGVASQASAMARKTNGVTQIITSLKQPSGQNINMGDTAIATVKKRGVLEDFNLIDQDGNPVIDQDDKPVIFQA